MQSRSMQRLLAVLFFSASTLSAHAIDYFNAPMNGSSENPPVATAATGTGTAIVDGNTMTLTITYSGLTQPLTATHIHCCAAPTANAGVAVDITAPAGATSGTYTQTVDLSLTSTYRAAFVTANGGTAAGARAALIAALGNGNAYFNIHTSAFPGGEIRGNSNLAASIPASLPVPVGGVATLALVAFLGIAGFVIRKRRSA